ncbi:MAG: class I SAM-dependent methyltransferase [Candidatus Altiarchaeota archaeon]|nr:class I SAM-dependent methyltransferase [Candidatus Altiarchaeota archaeon]
MEPPSKEKIEACLENFSSDTRATVESWLAKNIKFFYNEKRSLFTKYQDQELHPLAMCELYGTVLDKIDRDGTILDLGCGVGYVLKFLTETSPFRLEPFGIEKELEKVEAVKTEILPVFKKNFEQCTYPSCKLSKKEFDFIIVSVEGADLPALESRIRPGGKIFYNEFGDVKHKLGDAFTTKLTEMKASGYEQLPRLQRTDFPDRTIYMKKIL